jgi:hypothetical protein
MPRAKLTGPDGSTAWINVPDDASEEAIQGALRAAMEKWPKQPQQSMPWSEVATTAVSNIPKSAAEFGGNIAHAVTHPIETIKTVADVGYGGLSKAAGAVGVPMEPKAKAEREASFDAVADFFGDRYGSVDDLKRTIAQDPVGFAADASTVITGGAAVPARAPGVAGKVAQTVGAVGRAVDPITAAAKAIKLTGKKVVAPAVGVLTGAGAEPIRAASKAGYEGNRVFLDNMRGNAGINDTIDMAQSAMGQIRKDRSDAYKSGMEAVKASDAPISYAPVVQSIADAHGIAYYRGVPIDDVAAKTLSDIQAKVDQFREVAKAGPADTSYRAAEGFDALKQSIGEIRQSTQPGTKARAVADHVYNTIKAEITKQVPEYAQTMKGYADASDRITDLQKTFSISERAAPDTTARKLQSVMRNNVNTNYGRRTKLMDELAAKEPDLPAALAGQTLSSPTPRGLQGLGATGTGIAAITHMNPYLLPLIAASSPRLMGELGYGTGRVAAGAEGAMNAMKLSPQQLSQMLLAIYQAEQVARAGNGNAMAGGR